MEDKKFLKAVGISIVLIMLLITSIGVSYATTQSDLDKIEEKIEETNSEIAGVKSQMSQALSQINRLNTQITSYETEITDLNSKIDVLGVQIIEKEENVKQKEEEYKNKQDLLSKRIVAMYEAGTTSYLDVLLTSESLSDFLSRYYIIDQLVEADQDLLKSIEETKNKLEQEKNELETAKKDAEDSKEKVRAKSDALTVSVREKNNLVTNLTEEEKALQDKLEEFEQDKREIQRKLESISDKEDISQIVAPSAAGYVNPIPGKSKSNITTGYYSYSGHTGVDFACAGGTPIVAVKDGTVVISEAKKNANGSYRSYGEYIVINHHDGTMTLYAHGKPGSRLVSPGDSVKQGQRIMSVGTTGNSTGNHLHFEVRVKGRVVNPTPYLP